jgi:RNA polymerase primary sigma factor
MVETINRLVRVQRQLVQELGREPTSEEIALEMDLLERHEVEAISRSWAEGKPLEYTLERKLRRAASKVREIVRFSQEVLSTDEPVGPDATQRGDLIVDETIEDPEVAASDRLRKERIRSMLLSLTKREREVLDLRFGLTDGRARTLDEVGRALGVTRERIRQIEAKALRKLRRRLVSHRLHDNAVVD